MLLVLLRKLLEGTSNCSIRGEVLSNRPGLIKRTPNTLCCSSYGSLCWPFVITHS